MCSLNLLLIHISSVIRRVPLKKKKKKKTALTIQMEENKKETQKLIMMKLTLIAYHLSSTGQ